MADSTEGSPGDHLQEGLQKQPLVTSPFIAQHLPSKASPSLHLSSTETYVRDFSISQHVSDAISALETLTVVEDEGLETEDSRMFADDDRGSSNEGLSIPSSPGPSSPTPLETTLPEHKGTTLGRLGLLNTESEPIKSHDLERRESADGPSSKWSRHKKHFFIMSSAGKPIYSRHGDESKLSSYMGIMQAIISFFTTEDDSIRSITAGGTKFVFLMAGPLYLVTIATTGESDVQLREQLHFLHHQVMFVITGFQIDRIFENRVNYDLRNLLTGTDIFMDELSRSFYHNPGYFLASIKCLRMHPSLRTRIGSALTTQTPKQLLFGVMLAHDKLVTLVRPKRYSLHPSDLHLLVNMVQASSAFRTGESWIPVCLPKFNSRGFLHTYVSYISNDLCLILMSTERDAFFEMSAFRTKIVGSLEDCVEDIEHAIQHDPYSLVEVGIVGLRHFLYKSRNVIQYTLPALSAPYTNKQDYRRLMRMYQYAHEKMHERFHQARILWNVGPHEAILCWGTKQHEIFAAFSPLSSKQAGMASVQALLKWIRRNEDNLFLRDAPVY